MRHRGRLSPSSPARKQVASAQARAQAKKTAGEQHSVVIENLSNEGQGVARLNGKTLFVKGALPGETVLARIDRNHRRYDEGHMLELTKAAAERVEPQCPHFAQCGGCQLQHLNHDTQIDYKQQWVLDQLARQAQLVPEQLDAPLRSVPQHYRRAARIGINQRKDGSAIVGFRQEGSKYLIDIDQCLVLDPRGDNLFRDLAALLNAHPGQIKRITHAELTFGDTNGTLTLRVMKNLDGSLQQQLVALATSLGCGLYLNHGDHIETVHEDSAPAFNLPAFAQQLNFAPGDFVQVNAAMNQAMIDRAIEWLDPQADERILDLFCGLGNFTLPLASKAAEVVGIEASKEMVARGEHNASLNGLTNCQFEAADLTYPISARRWFKQGFDKVLIDPPRTGALEIIEQLIKTPVTQLLYVSCNPSALARDAITLKEAGFKLQRFCVMDMFPHTTHVESLALFVKH